MGDRVSALLRRRERRVAEAARAALPRPAASDPDGGSPRSLVVGLDPVRILLFGSGPFVGYGVAEHSDALDGRLAHLVAARTGRGVVLENRARPDLPTEAAVGSLGGAGTATYQVAVWAPRFGEEQHSSRVESRRTALRSLLRDYREQSAVPLVVCALPVPTGAGWRSMLRRPRVIALNRTIAREAALVPGVAVAPLPPYLLLDEGARFDADWYRAAAERLAPVVLRAAGLRERESVR